jgi:hypothetical protein
VTDWAIVGAGDSDAAGEGDGAGSAAIALRQADAVSDATIILIAFIIYDDIGSDQ